MTIFCLGASLSCKISLTPRKRRTQRQQKKHRREKKKGKNTNLVGAVIFFASKPLSAALFRVLSCKKNNLVCKLSSLSSSQSLGSERHTKTRRRRRQRRRRKRKTLRFVVNWFPSRSSFRAATRKEETFVVFIERGEISLRDEWVRRISHQSDRIETSARKYHA